MTTWSWKWCLPGNYCGSVFKGFFFCSNSTDLTRWQKPEVTHPGSNTLPFDNLAKDRKLQKVRPIAMIIAISFHFSDFWRIRCLKNAHNTIFVFHRCWLQKCHTFVYNFAKLEKKIQNLDWVVLLLDTFFVKQDVQNSLCNTEYVLKTSFLWVYTSFYGFSELFLDDHAI